MAHWRNDAAWTRPYVPVLRGHAGEFDALSWLRAPVKERVMPLVEMVPGATARDLVAAWGDAHPVLLDTLLLEDNAVHAGRHQLVELFDRCRGVLRAIPVGGLDRGIDHSAAIAGVAATHRRGAALRLRGDELRPDEQRDGALDGWLAVVDLAPDEVDLVLDVGNVGEPGQLVPLLDAHRALSGLPYAREWRSLTLAAASSSSFPPRGRDSEQLLDRLEWRLWKSVVGGALPRAPGFGDYAGPRPGRHEHSGASIAYTTGCSRLVVERGRVPFRSDEVRAASRALLARPEFAGAGHCRGCALIEEFAAGGSPGGREGWRAAAICHHIEASAAELAALSASRETRPDATLRRGR